MTSDDVIGLESGTVRVVPYHREWVAIYEAEEARLREVLGELGVELELEHCGSTAVPGLVAKPIIDILGGRRNEESRRAIIAALERAGYLYRGEQGIPGRDFFRRGVPRSYHIHVAEIGSAFWREHRAFRDYLRANSTAAAEYGRLKLELAARFPRDREAYIEGKTSFVRQILLEAAKVS